MRIFYAAGSCAHGALTESKIWHYNLYLPLCDLGYEVISLNYDLEPHYAHADEAMPKALEFNQVNRPNLEDALLRQIKKAHQQKPIDLFFSYFYASFVRPEVIREIRQMGILTVNWYCNASYQFHLIEGLASAYDYCLVPEKFRLDDYKRVGANPIYCQEAANPNIYKPYPLPQEYDVTFVGAQYGSRAENLRYMLDHGIDVRAWGSGWTEVCPPEAWQLRLAWWSRRAKRTALGQKNRLLPVLPCQCCGQPLSDDEMIRMYSRSKVSLGFSDVGDTYRSSQPIKQIRLRDFEAPMSGAFYMVEYMEELEEFYDFGKEVICYFGKVDLAERIKYYLTHEKEREQIRQAGHARAVRDHTWQKRFQECFRQIELKR